MTTTPLSKQSGERRGMFACTFCACVLVSSIIITETGGEKRDVLYTVYIFWFSLNACALAFKRIWIATLISNYKYIVLFSSICGMRTEIGWSDGSRNLNFTDCLQVILRQHLFHCSVHFQQLDPIRVSGQVCGLVFRSKVSAAKRKKNKDQKFKICKDVVNLA